MCFRVEACVGGAGLGGDSVGSGAYPDAVPGMYREDAASSTRTHSLKGANEGEEAEGRYNMDQLLQSRSPIGHRPYFVR